MPLQAGEIWDNTAKQCLGMEHNDGFADVLDLDKGGVYACWLHQMLGRGSAVSIITAMMLPGVSTHTLHFSLTEQAQ
jgi:hypothetical protein